jgi:hypothetical protein
VQRWKRGSPRQFSWQGVRTSLGMAATLVAAGSQVVVIAIAYGGQAVVMGGGGSGANEKLVPVWRGLIAGEVETTVRKEIKKNKDNMMSILTLTLLEM